MKRWIFAILVVCLGWSAFWLWEARALRQAYEGWAQDLRDTGWQVDHSALRIRGYPTRLDMTLTDPQLISPAGAQWQAPFVQVLGLSYQPGHHIIVWPQDQSLTYQGARYQINSDGMRASVVHDAQGQILRMNLEAQVLNVTGPKRGLAFADLTAGALMVQSGQYRLGMSSTAVAGSSSAQKADMQAAVSFDAPWSLRTLHHPRPQPQRITLQRASYHMDDLELSMAGKLKLSKNGTIQGALDLRAAGWQALLEQAVQAGHMPQSLASSLESGLALIAGLQGRSDTLDLPLGFSNGQVKLGPVPLGPAPVLRLP